MMVAAATCGQAWAEPAVTPDSAPAAGASSPDLGLQRRQALAHRYFAALHYDRMMDNMMKSLIPAMLDAESKRYPALPPKIREALAESATETMRDVLPSITEDTIAAMAKLYTEEELTRLVEFYESATGQAIMAKAPQLTTLMAGTVKTLMPRVRDGMLTRFCHKIDCKALPKPVETRPS